MSNKISNDLISAIYQIAEERGLSQEVVIEKIKEAYVAAYKKMNKISSGAGSDDMNLSVELDLANNEIYVFADKKVVPMVKNPSTEISESQAKLIDPNLREGDHIQIDVTPENFGRIAAKVALQKLLHGFREAEIVNIQQRYRDKVGKVVTGVIHKVTKNYVVVEIDNKVPCIAPSSELIPDEVYKVNDKKKFVLLNLQNSDEDKRFLLSRGSDLFLKALLELEIPEIANNIVEVVDIAREAGSRSKVAVRALKEKIDPIGACIGPKGSRIDNIMKELKPEKVDIIPHSDDPKLYISNALSPAKVSGVKINQVQKEAIVLVTNDILSLAIGKDGQNVRLAAKLTGYKIDITSETERFDSYKEVLET